jgi:hypothetical protein
MSKTGTAAVGVSVFRSTRHSYERFASGRKTMISKALAISIAVAALAAPACAEDTPGDTATPRYSFNKVADGFVRLDTETGEVALCSRQAVGWACLAAPEDRAVLENEIARLRRENGALKNELVSRGLPLPPGIMPEPSNGGGKDLTLRLPGQADVDRVMALVGRMWHRLVEAIAQAQDQVLHRS